MVPLTGYPLKVSMKSHEIADDEDDLGLVGPEVGETIRYINHTHLYTYCMYILNVHTTCMHHAHKYIYIYIIYIYTYMIYIYIYIFV